MGRYPTLKFTQFEGLDNLWKQLFLLVPHSAMQWLKWGPDTTSGTVTLYYGDSWVLLWLAQKTNKFGLWQFIIVYLNCKCGYSVLVKTRCSIVLWLDTTRFTLKYITKNINNYLILVDFSEFWVDLVILDLFLSF